MIKFHATICKHCKKNVDTTANNSLNLQPIPSGHKSQFNLNSWKITYQNIDKINKLFNFWLRVLIWGTVLLFFIICLPIVISSPSIILWTVFFGFFIIDLPILIASGVCFFMLIYQFWKLVPASEAETTPAKAVGFMFIPVFNFYWLFVAIWGVSKHFDNLAPQENIKKIGLVHVISWICCMIPFVNIVAMLVVAIFQILWIVRMRRIAVSAIPVIK